MQFKDYYDTLGVPPQASADEIKRAYRKLARKYHPDVSKESGAEDHFKAVNEAYEALKDPNRRSAYDRLRASGFRPGDQFRPPPDFGDGFDFGDIGGEGGFSDFFESLFGQGRRRSAGPRRGRDRAALVEIDLGTAFSGGSQRISLPEGRTLDVKIPAGILPGQQIRLGGQGMPGTSGARAGDLLLEIRYRPHPLFEVDGRNIVHRLKVAPWVAALGGEVAVPTLGGSVSLRIPEGSGAGRRMRLRGRGLPGQPPGDQLVVIEVDAPKAGSETQRSAWEALRDAYES
ncbi:MAG TPA: DnaJ C-terminal domain-containing protein [Xanthomonadaceae bacterium]|nr:DnaJ C-terminal domain-containing protein [Xanthomonadaceae bacterium]